MQCLKLWTAALVGNVLFGCSSSVDNSEITSAHVVGGREDYAVHPEGIGLLIETANGGMSACTGSVVRDDLVLTAAHCVVDVGATKIWAASNLEGGLKDVSSTGKLSVQYVSFPGYSPSEGHSQQLAKDVAFAIFPKGSFSGHPMAKIASSSPKAGDAVRLVGYGRTSNADPASNSNLQRHTGANRVAGFNNLGQGIAVMSEKVGDTTAGISPGDSGGPLFNAMGEQIGISSKATKVPNEWVSAENPHVSYFVNVNDPGVAEFIRTTMSQSFAK